MTLDEAIERLRDLNEPVPKPYPLPTEADVAAAEQRLGVKFHPDYRKYLLRASDVVYGALEPATITVADSHTDLTTIVDDARELGVPENLLPICEDNGDFYCMNAKGEIVYWSNDGSTEEKWPDLPTWIEEVWLGETGEE